jgi:hypothetical protein
VVELLVRLVPLAIFDDLAEKVVSDAGNIAIILDGRVNQVRPCDPDWLVIGEIVVPDVLSKTVVHGADWQNGAMGLHAAKNRRSGQRLRSKHFSSVIVSSSFWTSAVASSKLMSLAIRMFINSIRTQTVGYSEVRSTGATGSSTWRNLASERPPV